MRMGSGPAGLYFGLLMFATEASSDEVFPDADLVVAAGSAIAVAAGEQGLPPGWLRQGVSADWR